jgi:hypothetical protein
MRMGARFSSVRRAVTVVRSAVGSGSLRAFLDQQSAQAGRSPFSSLAKEPFVSKLERDGVAFGLDLPSSTVDQIVAFAAHTPSYADRNPALGFLPQNRHMAEAKLGKPILLSQFLNTTRECSAIQDLANDPVLLWIAGRYLGSVPTFLGANLWWTYPVVALEEDRNQHAHLYHRDVDDFRFFKFFFYLTDVPEGEGAHICVVGSHKQPPILKRSDRWNIRRYTDTEIETFYPKDRIVEICGKRGKGFAENTLCIHKASTPKTTPRLLLQLQFGLFDYGVMNDIVPKERMRLL